MSDKTLRALRFGESILSEYESFNYKVKCIHQKGSPDSIIDPDIYRIEFDWAWNGYEGYGAIDFYKSTSLLCNTQGNQDSNMTIASWSRRKQINGRNNCPLYNDASLAYIFDKMLLAIDLDKAITFDEWINSMKKII